MDEHEAVGKNVQAESDTAAPSDTGDLTPKEPTQVDDLDPEAEEEELPLVYTITAYGADYPVDGLVKRIEQGDIVVPEFQRGFIWPRARIDRFVESLLLGLPVPAFSWQSILRPIS